jgi:hypothetical protein
MQLTSVYRENNKITAKLSTQGEVIANYFSSIQNGKAIQGVTEFIQHFGVSVETSNNSDNEFIIFGHVFIADANFTPGEKVAANTFGTIGTIDKIEGSPFSRSGGVVFIIGIALTENLFYLQFDHTKPLTQVLVEGRKYMLEFFTKADHVLPSIAFPAICLSRLHPSDALSISIDKVNWPEFVPALRDIVWKVGANVSDIPYASFVPGLTTEIVLNPSNSASINQLLLEQIEGMLRYHNSVDWGDPLTSSHYLNLSLCLNFKGEDAKIIDINRITETISIDYDSSALTTDAGNVKIYPHRLPSITGNTAITPNLDKALLRKLQPETSIASGYSPSVLLENTMQQFLIRDSTVASVGGVTFALGTGGGGFEFLKYPEEDLAGTPRAGKTTRGNLMSAYTYIFGGRYVP